MSSASPGITVKAISTRSDVSPEEWPRASPESGNSHPRFRVVNHLRPVNRLHRDRPMKFLLAFVLAAELPAGDNIATILMRTALLTTQDGKDAASRLRSKWTPEEAALAAKNKNLQAEREKLRAENRKPLGPWPWPRISRRRERKRLAAAVNLTEKEVRREEDHDREYFQREQQFALNQLAERMKAVVDSYAKEHGYTVILDAESKESSVLASTTDITDEIIALYDLRYPPPK